MKRPDGLIQHGNRFLVAFVEDTVALEDCENRIHVFGSNASGQQVSAAVKTHKWQYGMSTL